MPLPLPNLDTRRWSDLVDEGRAMVPRYAPGWTDHNVHDPGITLIELFAWLVEADVYRANHISARCRRKFLKLIGFSPRPPEPSRTVLSFIAKSGVPAQLLPAGMTFRATVGSTQVPFRILADLSVIDSAIVAVQTTIDGTTFVDQSRVEQGRFGFPAWGLNPPRSLPVDPDKQPALYLGFSKPLPEKTHVTVRFWFAGPRADETERQRLMDEIKATEASCATNRPLQTCPPLVSDDEWCRQLPAEGESKSESEKPPQTLRHHSIGTAWDYFDGPGWRPLNEQQGEVLDDTRGFTLDGAVTVTLPTEMQNSEAFGVIQDQQGQPKKFFYLRCRLEKGQLDFPTIIKDIELNAVAAEQTTSAITTFQIKPGVTLPPGAVPVIGKNGHLNMDFDANGRITTLAFASDGEGPYARVLAYTAAKPNTPGSLTATLAFLGWGTSLPNQVFNLPNAPISRGSVRIWSLLKGTADEWELKPDLDASTRTDSHFVLSAMIGDIKTGDGERGTVFGSDAVVLGSYESTMAQGGNISPRAVWQAARADDVVNQPLLETVDINDIRESLVDIGNAYQSVGGTDEEDIDHAAGRAAEVLWAHERLLELCPPGATHTLDGLDRERVFARVAPARASTLLDYERLALDVPGAPIARARAWAGIDAVLPGVKAPGTVVVTIMPWLPAERPRPSRELLQAIHSYLDRRRVIGTRLVTVGPKYLRVSVKATIATSAGARPGRVVEDVKAALKTFLSPLDGGPAGRGWPFGRDVYRSEILEVIDQTPGVDHVEDLRLVGDKSEPQCGNLCVGPVILVSSGDHDIKVVQYQRNGADAAC